MWRSWGLRLQHVNLRGDTAESITRCQGELWKEGDGWVGGKGGTAPPNPPQVQTVSSSPQCPAVSLGASAHPSLPHVSQPEPILLWAARGLGRVCPPGRAASSSPSGLPLSHHQAWPPRAPEPSPWGSQPLPIQGNIAGSPTGV